MSDLNEVVFSFVSPDQFTKIVAWNKVRNDLVYSKELEDNMLYEELNEYFEAESIVDKLDAIADFFFVAAGTVAKYHRTKLRNPDQYYSDVSDDFVDALPVILADFQGFIAILGIPFDKAKEMIHRTLDIVIRANEQKGTEKDENGKIKKPDNFVKPEDQIAMYVADVIEELERKREELRKERELAQRGEINIGPDTQFDEGGSCGN